MRISLIYQFFTTLLFSKKSYIVTSLLASMSLTGVLDILSKHANQENTILMVTIFLIFVVLTGLFVMFDLITGIVAARYKGDAISSQKWGVTIGKFVGLTLYSVVAVAILLLIPDNYIVLVLVFGPLILTLLKEYISIGENFEKRFGKKSYMFSVLDRMFDIMELKFFQKMENRLSSSDDGDVSDEGGTSQEEKLI